MSLISRLVYSVQLTAETLSLDKKLAIESSRYLSLHRIYEDDRLRVTSCWEAFARE